jgi:hypothetical protein
MAKPTKKNHTGVESYDHSAVKALPEYQQVHQALDALVRAVTSAGAGVGQAEWLRMTEQMAASLPYSDSSGHSNNGCPGNAEGATCGYAVNIADFI